MAPSASASPSPRKPCFSCAISPQANQLAFEKLCDLFDQRTNDGADMSHYDGIVAEGARLYRAHFPAARGRLAPVKSRRDATDGLPKRRHPRATISTL